MGGFESTEGISSVEILSQGSDSIFELNQSDEVQLSNKALQSFEWCEES